MDRIGRIVGHLSPAEALSIDLPVLENVKSERRGRVALLTLTREQALNSLWDALVADMAVCLKACEDDGNIGYVVLPGAGRAFAFA